MRKRKPEGLSRGPQPAARVSCNRGQILVVDDEAAIARLFDSILSSAFPDKKVETASNGSEAVYHFSREHHGLLLMDLHMPVMDGQTAYRAIVELCEGRNWEMPTIVFCTGFAPPSLIRSVVAGNSHHCLLCKPVSGDRLVDVIRKRLPEDEL